MLLVEGSSETPLYRHLSNNVFRNPEFRKYISYEGHLFFQSVTNFIYISKMQQKIEKKNFCYLDNCIWIGCVNLSLLRRENLWRAVNMFTNSAKILHIPKGDFLQLNCLHIYQSICQRCCGSGFNSVLARLPCCFSKGLQKQDFLDIYLSTVFGVHNIQTTWANTVSFLENFQNFIYSWKIWKKIRKSFSFYR